MIKTNTNDFRKKLVIKFYNEGPLLDLLKDNELLFTAFVKLCETEFCLFEYIRCELWEDYSKGTCHFYYKLRGYQDFFWGKLHSPQYDDNVKKYIMRIYQSITIIVDSELIDDESSDEWNIS